MRRIALFLFGFLLPVVHAQQAPPLSVSDCENPPNLRASVNCRDSHPHDLTTKDLIAILADYDLKHADQQPFFRPAFGVTNFETTPPAVWIFNTGDTPSRRSTVIHELLHVHYHQLGLNPPEEFIRAEEDRQYQMLFNDPAQ